MTKIDALLRTLDALSNANRSGYKCNSEMDTVISALLDELKKPADVYPAKKPDYSTTIEAHVNDEARRYVEYDLEDVPTSQLMAELKVRGHL